VAQARGDLRGAASAKVRAARLDSFGRAGHLAGAWKRRAVPVTSGETRWRRRAGEKSALYRGMLLA
jgi:hypothetical protein